MKKTCKAFTLLEVLVALAVLAISMSALVKVSISNSSNAVYLKQKTIAHWIAMNKVNEIKLSGTWPDTGDKKGTLLMARQQWRWRIKVKPTPDQNTRRVEVGVGLQDEDDSISQVVAYIGRPL